MVSVLYVAVVDTVVQKVVQHCGCTELPKIEVSKQDVVSAFVGATAVAAAGGCEAEY